MNKKEGYIVFTDGASRGNPGPGGFAAIIVSDFPFSISEKEDNPEIVELGGREDRTTNNRMELTAAIRALQWISKINFQSHTKINVTLCTDSNYLINGATKWVYGWQKNNWTTAAKEKVLNKDLWLELIDTSKRCSVEWIYVPGHSGHSANERADNIATDFADQKKVRLYSGPKKDYGYSTVINQQTTKTPCRSFKAYSYISMIDGHIETHKTWSECEARVKGKRGARFKKVADANEEAILLKKWQSEK